MANTYSADPRRGRINPCRAWLAGIGAIALVSAGTFAPAAPTGTEKSSGQTAATPGSDWPQWRGPNRDGHSPDTGLLKQWPAGGPKLLWKSDGIGVGFAAVTFEAGKIFTSGDKDGSAFVHCLDENGGKVLWSTKLGESGGKRNEGPRGTPTLDGDRLYTVGQAGELVCLETAGGKEVWRKNLLKDFNGKMMSGWGFSESPLIDGDKLICTPGGGGGTLAALDKKTGKVIWRSKNWTDPAGYASVIVVDYGGKRQYIQVTEHTVAGIDAENGNVLWKGDKVGKTAVIATPVFHDGIVYVTCSYKMGCDAFKVDADKGKFKAEKLYSNHVMENHHGGVVLVDDHIYGYSDAGGWTCQDLKTGKQVWQEGGGGKRGGAGKAPGKGSILYADGMLVLRDEATTGLVALIEATPKGYVEKGRFNQPERSKEPSWSHPVISSGKLYLRDGDKLFCYDVKGK